MEKIISDHSNDKELFLLWDVTSLTYNDEPLYHSYIEREYDRGFIKEKLVEYVSLAIGPRLEIYQDLSGSLIEYKENKKNGLFIKWWSNGVFEDFGFYENDLKVGEWRGWYFNSLPRYSIFYKAGKPHGIFESYNIDGSLKEKGLYNLGSLVYINYY